eukprot:3673741-Pyramimonas_sp.AAC.1
MPRATGFAALAPAPEQANARSGTSGPLGICGLELEKNALHRCAHMSSAIGPHASTTPQVDRIAPLWHNFSQAPPSHRDAVCFVWQSVFIGGLARQSFSARQII